MKLPIFPLPVFILPGGMTRLKVFESRYLKMVTIALKQEGFAILLDPRSSKSTPVASWVDIINFDTDEGGMLLIDVKCRGLIAISAAYRDQDNLMWATAAVLEHWPEHGHNELTKVFSELLNDFFVQSEALHQLYRGGFVEQPNWVVARWLELLPIDNQYKEHFLKASSYESAQLLLSAILSENQFRLSDLK